MGVVTVYLDKISNLQDEDSIGKSDPYVVFRLEQVNTIIRLKGAHLASAGIFRPWLPHLNVYTPIVSSL